MTGFVRDHWRSLAELVLLIALAATSWSAFHREPTPAVHEKAEEHAAVAQKADVDTFVKAAPEHEVIAEKFACHVLPADPHMPADPEKHAQLDASAPQLIERVTTIDRGEVITETKAATETVATEDRKLDLTITPQAMPGWALQVGFEDVLAARTLRVAARRHLFGPLWVELSAVPMQRSIGVAAAVEW